MSKTPYPKAQVAALIGDALRGFSGPRRSACEVTSDRIGDFLTRHGAEITGEERDVLSRARDIIETAGGRES